MLLTELNQLDLQGTNIDSAYDEAHTKEKSSLLLDLNLITW